MWHILALDVVHFGRTPGGAEFTSIIDAILRNHCFNNGIPDSDISTNLRVNKQDGGVDTEIRSGVPADATGRMRRPSVWQYKAKQQSDITEAAIRSELEGWYVRERIADGYVYRFCVCDEIAAPTKQRWEEILLEEAKKINSNAEVQVLSAGDIASWANRYVGVILQFFRPMLSGIATHFNAWGQNITASTTAFVQVDAWKSVQEQIRNHLNWLQQPIESICRLTGMAGVGKTRLVYEVLKELPNAAGLVVYTDDDEAALEIANHLVNDASAIAILVADECPPHTQQRLEKRLRGHKQRVRVVAIDNSDIRSSLAPELELRQIPNDTVNEILNQNYAHVPKDRRLAYASLAKGFVRLAADMCDHDADIQASGGHGFVPAGIEQYYRTRFDREDDRKVVDAIALVSQVGYREDVADELLELCNFVGLNPQLVLETAGKLHDSPGFIQRAGRYLYVTPDIVARVAFACAWSRWAEDPDPDEFLKRIPTVLLNRFNERVQRSATIEVRKRVASFFFRAANELTAEDLSNPDAVGRLIQLVYISPDTFLPLVRRLVENASAQQLKGPFEQTQRSWGPRRELVWLCEHMVAFPEYYADAESILFRLACAESEPGIANNATAIWRQIHRVYLSGTATPFAERLEALERRLATAHGSDLRVALSAIAEVIGGSHTRTVGDALVSGRIPPEEWRPKTQQDYEIAIDAYRRLLERLAENTDQEVTAEFKKMVLDNAYDFVEAGFVVVFDRAFSRHILTVEEEASVLNQMAQFLALHKEATNDGIQRYTETVRQFIATHSSMEFHSRLVRLISLDPWNHYEADRTESISQIVTLAKELYADPLLFSSEMQWLCSEAAKSSALLGEKFGALDTTGRYLEQTVESAFTNSNTAFARGYMISTLAHNQQLADRYNALLDHWQLDEPQLCYELFTTGGDHTRSIQRALMLFDNTLLATRHFRAFLFGVNRRPLTVDEFIAVLSRLNTAITTSDEDASEVALNLIAYRLHVDEEQHTPEIVQDERIRELCWNTIERAREPGRRGAPWWIQILKKLATFNPARAAAAVSAVLVSRTFYPTDLAVNFLGDLAREHPATVMEEIGRAALDPQGVYLRVWRQNGLLDCLPPEVVINWINTHGIDAARSLSRQLPLPYVSEDGVPVVPEITEFVFEKFGQDDEVFAELCMAKSQRSGWTRQIVQDCAKDIQDAKRFLAHPNQRVRAWADYVIRSCESEIARITQDEEEHLLQ